MRSCCVASTLSVGVRGVELGFFIVGAHANTFGIHVWAGTHLWLRVERDQSTATLTGIGGLPVRESFSMWGRPVLGSVEAELASISISRLDLAPAATAAAAAAPAAPAAPVQQVKGGY